MQENLYFFFIYVIEIKDVWDKTKKKEGSSGRGKEQKIT